MLVESVLAATSVLPLRPPSVPLVVHTPSFSIWAPADKLTDTWPRHWTGRIHALQAMVKVNGRPYRILGPSPSGAPALTQTKLETTFTRTLITSEGPGFAVDLAFITPILPSNLAVLSRPVTYVEVTVRSLTDEKLDVDVSFDATAELAVEDLGQKVKARLHKAAGVTAASLGTLDQPVLAKKGDDLRIDWGYLALASSEGVITPVFADDFRSEFTGLFSGDPAWTDTRAASQRWPGLGWRARLGEAGREGRSATLMIAYDEVWSINHFGRQLRPYWRKTIGSLEDLLTVASREMESLKKKCEEFDAKAFAALAQDGGDEYASLCALAYRQAWGGHVLVEGEDGSPLLFSKENFSNGCIATVDVTYPSSPLFFLSGKEAGRALLRPALDYGASERWKFPFAPHDLGTFPHATGQVYGGGERTEEDQMPVEESGNMLILVAAQCELEGSADFAKKYWPVLTKWADYLAEHGIDPAHQLCTDDFAGHMARNANLSLKAINGLGAFAKVAEMAGEKEEAAKRWKQAKEGAAKWMELAGKPGETVLAFGAPGTWSQKYNLIWDELLDLDLFPKDLAKKEREAYLGRQQTYGLPLDSRKTYTKLDWILWSACLGAPTNQEFGAFVKPVLKFVNETPNRVPLTDWYETTDGRHVGFQARTVVGGVFLRTLQKRGIKPFLAGL